jgi:hypothetical protein
MSRKRKRRSVRAPSSQTPADLTSAPATRPEEPETAPPFPSFAASLARGLAAVGSSPIVLIASFVSLLATWAAFVALGTDSTPRLLAVAMAISPAHLFTDVPVAFAATDPVGLLVGLAGLALLRGTTFAAVIALLAEALQGGTDLRGAVRRIPGAALTLATIFLVEVGLVVVLLQLVAGFLGQLAPVLVAAAIYFLAFAPVVAVLEGTGLRDAFRRGLRAARLPGAQHVVLVVAYFVFLFFAASISPFGPLAPATPTVLVWAFGLAMTFLHVAVLGALVLRWLAVRDAIPAGPPRSATGRS